MALCLTGCTKVIKCGECPMIEPDVEWSPSIPMMIGDEKKNVKCVTLEDYNRLIIWTITMQNTFCK